MAAPMFEPACREGDAERATAAQVPVVSRRQRQMLAVGLAALACVAVISVAFVGDNAGAESELLGAVGAGVGSIRNRDVLEQLLAEVERAGSGIAGDDSSARPVELEQKAGKSKPCNASCKQRKKEIAARMKALRDQINHDFQAMTSFGHKAGYLPPPQSIKAQVMSGTLLSTKNEPVAPPPFSPTVASTSSSKSSAPAAVSSPVASAGSSAADSAPPSDPPALDSSADLTAAALSSKDQSSSSDDSSSDDTSSSDSDDDSSSSSSSSSSKGSSTWAKAFAFMHHTDNPVGGDAASRADTGSEHSSSKKITKGDLFKSDLSSDKFLAGFEDPDSSDSSTKTSLASSTHSHHSSLTDPDSPLDKGADPLKSAESDKFLDGFLGSR